MPRHEIIGGRPGGRVHAYPFADVLRAESLSLTIAETLWNAYRLWTDPAYRDSRPPLHVIGQIGANLVQEVSAALDDLIRLRPPLVIIFGPCACVPSWLSCLR